MTAFLARSAEGRLHSWCVQHLGRLLPLVRAAFPRGNAFSLSCSTSSLLLVCYIESSLQAIPFVCSGVCVWLQAHSRVQCRAAGKTFEARRNESADARGRQMGARDFVRAFLGLAPDRHRPGAGLWPFPKAVPPPSPPTEERKQVRKSTTPHTPAPPSSRSPHAPSNARLNAQNIRWAPREAGRPRCCQPFVLMV